MKQAGTQVIPSIIRSGEVMLAMGVMGILLVMIIPIPRPVMDVLLALNFTFSIVILMVAMYILKPLEFSVFPSILLVATLFRLSLNIASTRLILLHGYEGPGAAGQVIKAFGTFVVGGNYVVGMVVFLILVVINFIVITRGAGRIAEVAARFTLDAMPGKQMSIDADLNAGLIDDRTARLRRQQIEREADFYGAMDGASKFVRGDAIASIIITLVNVIGGLIIGVAQQGMPLVEAAQTYTLLTIGDGLVSQVPALIVSTAAGIVVTRAASESHLGSDVLSQIMSHTKAVGMAAGILLFFAVLPGLPKLPFLMLGTVAGTIAYLGHRADRKRAEEQAIRRMEEEKKAIRTAETVESLLPLDILELEIGYGLIPLVDVEQDGRLLERIRMIRHQIAMEMGIIIPLMHIRDNLQLKPNQYTIKLKGVRIAEGEIMMGHCLALEAGEVRTKIKGIPTREPTFGLPALWIPEREKERAQAAGYTVVDPDAVMATHLSEVFRSHLYELLSRQDVQKLLDNVSKTHPKVVEELIPRLLSLGEVHRVLQGLLKEQVSIRDLVTILETLADWAPITKNIRLLTEYVRWALGRSITQTYLAPDGSLPALLLDPSLEEMLMGNIKQTETDAYLVLEPNRAREVVMAVQKALEPHLQKGLSPVLLCDPGVRPHLRQLLEKSMPTLPVLSHNEVAPNVTVRTLGIVRL